MRPNPRNEKGPAEAATSPSHGPTSPAKGKAMNSRDNIIDVPSSASEIDEPTRLGIRWNAMQERMEDLSGKHYQAKKAHETTAEIHYASAIKYAADEMDAVRSILPFAKATTLSGAAVQIIETINAVDLLIDQFPENDDYSVKKNIRAIDLLLHSVLDLVDSLADQKLADIAPTVLHPSLNPWTSVEERIALVEAAA